jgi:hypothetical protein
MFVVEHHGLRLGKWYWIVTGLFMLSLGPGALLTMHVRYAPSLNRKKAKAMHNPLRAIDPARFDKGGKINQRAGELQRAASADASESEAVTALSNALGNQVAAMVARHPHMSMDEILDMVWRGVREQAYMAAGIKSEDATELNDDQFNNLASRLVNAAATHTVPSDALAATAKALGVLISFTARRENRSPEELVKVGQDAVEQFAREATTKMGRFETPAPPR